MASGEPSAQAKAEDILKNVDVVSAKTVGGEGRYSEFAWALSVLVQTNEEDFFAELCHADEAEVYSYGLIGLYITNRDLYYRLKKQVDGNVEVNVHFGSISSTIPMSKLLENVESTLAEPYYFERGSVPSILDTVRPFRAKYGGSRTD